MEQHFFLSCNSVIHPRIITWETSSFHRNNGKCIRKSFVKLPTINRNPPDCSIFKSLRRRHSIKWNNILKDILSITIRASIIIPYYWNIHHTINIKMLSGIINSRIRTLCTYS